MALTIKSIPVLKEKEAENFVKKAEKAASKSSTVDFSKELKKAHDILKKAKMM
jgi:hypothetical protein